MKQDERRVYLLKYLMGENRQFGTRIPEDKTEQQKLLRALMNVRGPEPISNEFLKIQDDYLLERAIERGITDVNDILPVQSDDRLCIWQGDITTLKCDAIVNACNNQMLGCFAPLHYCIDNFIHTYAGVQLRLEMNNIMEKQGYLEPTGQAKITGAYNLPARYILHTVGPIIRGNVTERDEALLASCYRKCMLLAAAKGVESIVFCCLSTGVFRFPQERAARIAIATVKECLAKNDNIKKVVFNVFKDSDLAIYTRLLAVKSR